MSKQNRRHRTQNTAKPVIGSTADFFNAVKTLDTSSWVRILIVAQLIFIAWQFSPSLCTNGDNARYLTLGKALVEGKGYRNIQEPSTPLEAQYPVLFPALLGFAQIFTDNFVFSKIVISIIAALILLLLFKTYSGLPRHIVMPALACTALSALMAEYSTILMSEIPYLFFSVFALYLLKKSLKKPDSRFLFWAAAAMSIAPVNCRSIGIAFTAAWILWSIIAKKPRYAIMHVVLVILTVSMFKSFVPSAPYILQLFERNSYDPEAGFANIAELGMRILQNAGAYLGIITRNSLIPMPADFPQFIGSFFSKICIVLIITGWMRFLFIRSLRIIGIYLFFYAGILLLWQTQWSGERFIISIVPFLFLVLFCGVDSYMSFFNTLSQTSEKAFFKNIASGDFTPPLKRTSGTIWIIAAIIILFNVSYAFVNSGSSKAPSPDWVNFYSCADWARTHTPSGTIFMCRKPEIFYVRSHRQCLCYPYTHDVEKIIESMEINHVRYVIHDNFAWTKTTARYLYPAVSAHPERFRIVYALKNPDTFVLEFLLK